MAGRLRGRPASSFDCALRHSREAGFSYTGKVLVVSLFGLGTSRFCAKNGHHERWSDAH